MVKKTITYTDFNGNERTEDFHFNLTKKEALAMEFSETDGLSTMLEKIIEEKDNYKIIEFFQDFLLKSYGVKSEDGRRFVKNEELSIEFSQTEAYSDLFMLLALNTDEAIKFVKGVIPDTLNKSDGDGQTTILEKIHNDTSKS